MDFVQKYKMTFNMVYILYAWSEPNTSYRVTNNLLNTVCFTDILKKDEPRGLVVRVSDY